MKKFKIGDVVVPTWSSNLNREDRESIGCFEVIGHDGEFITVIHLNDAHTLTGYDPDSVLRFFESEISIDEVLTRDRKLSKLV